MMRKVFGVKNITHLLYGIIVLLPMMAILGRVCYTVANKNAKDSYSSKEQIVSKQTVVNNMDLLLPNNTYYFDSETYSNKSGVSPTFYYNAISFSPSDYGWDNLNYVALSFRNGAYTTFYTADNTAYEKRNTELLPSFSLQATTIDNITQNTFAQIPFTFYKNVYVYEQTSELDNAFEYSLKTFTEDNNLGEVDMFSWFTDLFLDHSNAHNQIYIGFVNWYLNYTMLVSCGYLFFLVLIWFINFIRKILDKSMYQDYGGF